LHFWGSFYGILLTVFMLSIAGLAQGFTFDNPMLPFISSVNRMEPLLVGRTIAMFFLLGAHSIFAYHFYLMLLSLGRPAGEATLFGPPDETGPASTSTRELAAA
jgi:cbb3-type cytochrome oxidase subunit 1